MKLNRNELRGASRLAGKALRAYGWRQEAQKEAQNWRKASRFVAFSYA
jgi:hypothetical protein